MLRSFRWMDYVDAFEEESIWGRGMLARLFGVSVSTASYHLEKAVEAGELEKRHGYLGGQSGWLYALPGYISDTEVRYEHSE